MMMPMTKMIISLIDRFLLSSTPTSWSLQTHRSTDLHRSPSRPGDNHSNLFLFCLPHIHDSSPFNSKTFAGVAANAATLSSFPNHSSPTGTELSPNEATPQNCSSRSGPSFATGFSTSTALQTTHSIPTTTRWRTSSSPPAPPTLQCEGFGCTGTGAKVVDQPPASATLTPRAPTTR